MSVCAHSVLSSDSLIASHLPTCTQSPRVFSIARGALNRPARTQSLRVYSIALCVLNCSVCTQSLRVLNRSACTQSLGVYSIRSPCPQITLSPWVYSMSWRVPHRLACSLFARLPAGLLVVLCCHTSPCVYYTCCGLADSYHVPYYILTCSSVVIVTI